MKRSITTIDTTDHRKEHITAFSAEKKEYGLKIEVIGCVELQPTRNTSQDVIGIIELDDQVVPILDSRKEKTSDLTDLSCIVILENLVGDATIMTGRLYENSCRVFDLINEHMDSLASQDSTQEDSVGSLPPILSTMSLE